jgi:hypothetical protein
LNRCNRWPSAAPASVGYQGVTSPYTIKNGQVVTTFSHEPCALRVYKLGNTYYGARSNEFGYPNYELLPKPPVFIHPLGTGEPAQRERRTDSPMVPNKGAQ